MLERITLTLRLTNRLQSHNTPVNQKVGILRINFHAGLVQLVCPSELL